jgi:hypothetical protein
MSRHQRISASNGHTRIMRKARRANKAKKAVYREWGLRANAQGSVVALLSRHCSNRRVCDYLAWRKRRGRIARRLERKMLRLVRDCNRRAKLQGIRGGVPVPQRKLTAEQALEIVRSIVA